MKEVRYKTKSGNTETAYFINKNDFKKILQEERKQTLLEVDARIDTIVEMKVRKYMDSRNGKKHVLARNPELAAVTKRLLKNYRKILQAVDSVILERCREEKAYTESFEWFEKLMKGKDPDILLDIMEENNYITASLICRLETAIQQYRDLVLLADPEAGRRCDILTCYYLAPDKKTVPELADLYKIQKTTIYNSLQRATEEIAALLFPDQNQKG